MKIMTVEKEFQIPGTKVVVEKGDRIRVRESGPVYTFKLDADNDVTYLLKVFQYDMKVKLTNEKGIDIDPTAIFFNARPRVTRRDDAINTILMAMDEDPSAASMNKITNLKGWEKL